MDYSRICKVCKAEFTVPYSRGGGRYCLSCRNQVVLCACGCRTETNAYQDSRYKEIRFIHGHNGVLNRGKKKNTTPEMENRRVKKIVETQKRKRLKDLNYGISKKEFECTCKICDNSYTSNKYNSCYCPDCKNKKVPCACGCDQSILLIGRDEVYHPGKLRFAGGHNSLYALSFKAKNTERDETKYGEYRRRVGNITRKNKKELFSTWSGLCYYTGLPLITNDDYKERYPDKSTSCNQFQPTIDHKVSLVSGFNDGLDAECIGGIDNLCVCARFVNGSKNAKPLIDFVFDMIKKHKTLPMPIRSLTFLLEKLSVSDNPRSNKFMGKLSKELTEIANSLNCNPVGV